MSRSCRLSTALAVAAWLPSCSEPPPALPAPTEDRGGKQAPEPPRVEPPNPTAKALAGLFGVASRVVTGRLKMVQDVEAFDQMTVTIGDAWVFVGGDGKVVPKEDANRVRSLVGQIVTAGINERKGWWGDDTKAQVLMGDGAHLCLASEEEMRGLVATRQRLEAERLWLPDALVMETGAWEHSLARLPTEEGASITSAVEELLSTDRRALAGDIISWYCRTVDSEFAALPRLRLQRLGLGGPWRFEDVRMLAIVVVEAALGLRPHMLIREQWQRPDACRRLWMLAKLLRSVDLP